MSDTGKDILLQLCTQGLSKSNGGGALAFAQWRGRDAAKWTMGQTRRRLSVVISAVRPNLGVEPDWEKGGGKQGVVRLCVCVCVCVSTNAHVWMQGIGRDRVRYVMYS